MDYEEGGILPLGTLFIHGYIDEFEPHIEFKQTENIVNKEQIEKALREALKNYKRPKELDFLKGNK